jgi:hypothetical protein
MEAPVSALRLAVLPLLVAASLAAQAPPSTTEASTPVAAVSPVRGAFFDLAALAGDRARLGFEPLKLGPWTIELVAAHSRTSTVLMDTHPLLPPGTPGPIGSKVSEGWSLDVAVRYYPAPFAVGGPHRGLSPYVGTFLGYHTRTVSIESDLTVIDGVTGLPVPSPIQRLTGFEPGAEAGLRLSRLGPLFLDVGGWFQLVTIDDPTRSVRPGQMDVRLVAAVGLGW